jgi:hypothetical protein
MGVGVLIYNHVKGLDDEQAIAIPFGPALGVAALMWLFWSRAVLTGFISAREWVLAHEQSFLMAFVPVLIILSGWLVFRIRMIRKYNRELMEAETEEAASEKEDSPHA